MPKNFMGPIDEEPIEFTEASALANIISGETLKVIFGKLLKAFNGTTGHDHDGTDSKKIAASNVDGLADYFNKTTGHDHDGTDSKKIAASNVDGLADYFNASTGHDHDGTDSKKIAVANVTNAVADTGDSMTGALSIQPGTDVVPLTAKGNASTTKNLLEAQISDGTVHFAVGKDAGTFTIKAGTAPSAANATGVAGTLIIAADGIYLCTETNTWVKAALATWE